MEQNINYLMEIFGSSDSEKKIELLKRIARDSSERALQFLINCLADEHWNIRKTAAEHISSYGEAAIPALSCALSSYNPDIQYWALQILGNMGIKGMPAILRAMKNPNEEIRFFACVALGKFPIAQGVTPLLRALGDEKWRVRKSASDALARYGEAVIAPLQQVLNTTEDDDIRFWAIKTLGKLGPKAQKFLLEALRNGDKKIRYVIAAALGESGDKRVVKVLIESLADPDWTIRKSATMALAEIGDNAVEMILEYLRTPNEDIREGCLRALVRIGDSGLKRLFDEIIKMDDNHRFLIRKSIVKIGSKVVEPLMSLFKLNEPEILSFAASALGEIGNPRSVPVLVTGLSHPNWNVRRSCAYALSEIGERGVDKIAEALKSPNDDVRYWVTRILESIGELGVPYLIKALQDPNREIRFFAAKALGGSYDHRVVRSLINSLSDRVWSVRKAAAESIIRINNINIEDLLRHVVSDNADIRYWINYILSQIGTQHLPKVVECMRKGDAELRLYACQAAGIIASPELIDPLIIALRDDNEWVRTYAAISLGQIGDSRAIIPLIRCFSDRNTDVRRNVIAAFRKLGDKVFGALVKCIEGNDIDLKKNAAIAFAEINDERGIDYIIMMMDDPNESVRSTAAEALGYFPCVKSRTILTKALEDESVTVRLNVIKSLGNISAEAEILALVNHLNKSKDEREIRTVKRTLSEKSVENPDLFIGLFKNEFSAVKNAAYEALVSAGMDVMARLSQEVAENKNETVVFWCKKTIKAIKEAKEIPFYG